MQHSAGVLSTYAYNIHPSLAPKEDLLAFPKTSLSFLGLPDTEVPRSGEVLDEQVNRLIAGVPEGPDAVGRVEEIRRNATIVRAYVFASLDKRSGGWSTTSLDEDETNYTTLEAKKEELERQVSTAKRGHGEVDERVQKKLKEVTKKRDETKARYIASLSKEIMKVARAALGRMSPEPTESSEAGGVGTSMPSPAPSHHSTLDATATTDMHRNTSFASFDGMGDTSGGTSDPHHDGDGLDALDLANALELGDLLSDAELRTMDLDDGPTATEQLLASVGKAASSGSGKSLPPLPAIDLSLLSPQKVVVPPSRPTRMSWCSWPSE